MLSVLFTYLVEFILRVFKFVIIIFEGLIKIYEKTNSKICTTF
jgi:hypothetical protein